MSYLTCLSRPIEESLGADKRKVALLGLDLPWRHGHFGGTQNQSRCPNAPINEDAPVPDPNLNTNTFVQPGWWRPCPRSR